MPRRVAITGMGVVSPNGIGLERFWDAISHGRGAAGPVTQFDASDFPSRIAAEVPDFDPGAAGLSEEQIERTDRSAQFALACAYEALEDSGLDLKQVDPRALGVTVSTSVAGVNSVEPVLREILATGNGRQVADSFGWEWYTRTMINRAAIEVAQAFGAHNMCSSIAAACATGNESVGLAWRAIRNGEADVIVAGGTDAIINPIVMAGFCAMGALTRRNDDPLRASRPFDADRDGFLIGEGAGVMILEELEHARARKAHIYAEVIGYAATANAYHMVALPKEGTTLARALLRSMAHAGVKPEHLGYINAHGTSTGQNDVYETTAYKEAFGEQAYQIPISSTKSMTGHSEGGANAFELMLCALAIERGLLPPTINYEHPDPACDLDYIPNVAREARIAVALSDANGFGGLQSSVVLARHGWQP